MVSYERAEYAGLQEGRESEEGKKPTDDFLFPQEMIMQIQRDRQAEPLQEQFELFSVWREEEKDQLGKILLADTFTNVTQKMDKWEQARFYPGGSEFGPAADVSKKRCRESMGRPAPRLLGARTADGENGNQSQAACQSQSTRLRTQTGVPSAGQCDAVDYNERVRH